MPVVRNRRHKTVNHAEGEHARHQDDENVVSTNAMESGRSTLKASTIGVYRKMSPKHMPAYLKEKTGRGNMRDLTTMDQMGALAHAVTDKRPCYIALTAKTPDDIEAQALRDEISMGIACLDLSADTFRVETDHIPL